ncbi:Rhodanese-like protein [Punctularia strigosozonata HHB-11173 SS5]|uniref:Rhodanese-like protein n=1 Tax=Punctularia strigosozonata (strain HHB-11173) TaxID=741275 RepID=UPI00044172A7|nr:Rhodanese-like protein [Punctularia strigosozonata HHB-11173 SS5]EIN13574.1 Rhodanese-like protein [Punctularia strigosozonata HHB-11173 SS5]
MSTAPLLVSPHELKELENSGAKVLDASWFMPGSPRKPKEELLAKRIPGAQFLDLDAVASKHELGLKHMLPAPRVFADACEEFGIEPSSRVVMFVVPSSLVSSMTFLNCSYDTHGVFSSPRALYMFRAFGHANSSVLNGGLPAWIVAGYDTESGPIKTPEKTAYPTPTLDEHVVRGYEDIVANSERQPTASPEAELVLDARSRGRWLGTDPEPRSGMSSGHIPNSFSLPFNAFLQSNDISNSDEKYTTFKSPAELEKELLDVLGPEFGRQVKQGERRVVTTCGSGMTAGVLWLGLKLLEVPKIALYDESWTGYASRASSVIEKAA